MSEHRLIEQALGSLETLTLEVEAGLVPERSLIGDYAAFFRGFADTCHHGKEEDILFRRLMDRGLPRESGPLAVMYAEHEAGRAHVRRLAAIANGPGALGPLDVPILIQQAGAFIPLLRSHILKEDRVLYPMAMQVLTGPEMDEMETEFGRFEAGMRADGSFDRLHSLAARLTTHFRPDPQRMAEAARLAPCGG
jgi:hemerythrin-like domain-containing protein